MPKVVYLATTNQLTEVDERLLRPSRFDLLVEIGPPDAATRRRYLDRHAPEMPRVQSVVAETEGLTYADLREIVVATQCLGKPLDETIAALRKRSAAAP